MHLKLIGTMAIRGTRAKNNSEPQLGRHDLTREGREGGREGGRKEGRKRPCYDGVSFLIFAIGGGSGVEIMVIVTCVCVCVCAPVRVRAKNPMCDGLCNELMHSCVLCCGMCVCVSAGGSRHVRIIPRTLSLACPL